MKASGAIQKNRNSQMRSGCWISLDPATVRTVPPTHLRKLSPRKQPKHTSSTIPSTSTLPPISKPAHWLFKAGLKAEKSKKPIPPQPPVPEKTQQDRQRNVLELLKPKALPKANAKPNKQAQQEAEQAQRKKQQLSLAHNLMLKWLDEMPYPDQQGPLKNSNFDWLDETTIREGHFCILDVYQDKNPGVQQFPL
eukprot:TRINITY_DN12675_c0_g1_i2.p1 TRINITY_DN12675_c0_g1~~TRINITY_DN12675_c0_g1_i2.p1  ORF type:complete len:194 (-),score=7.67 TRINITY_DN12675_c0_g1_i2:117-698(-)